MPLVFSIRGAFLSTIYTTENVGFLIAYTFSYFDYYAMPLFAVVLTAMYTILIVLLPETPIFLMRQNKIDVSRKTTIAKEYLLIGYFDRQQKNLFAILKVKTSPCKMTFETRRWKSTK